MVTGKRPHACIPKSVTALPTTFSLTSGDRLPLGEPSWQAGQSTAARTASGRGVTNTSPASMSPSFAQVLSARVSNAVDARVFDTNSNAEVPVSGIVATGLAATMVIQTAANSFVPGGASFGAGEGSGLDSPSSNAVAGKYVQNGISRDVGAATVLGTSTRCASQGKAAKPRAQTASLPADSGPAAQVLAVLPSWLACDQVSIKLAFNGLIASNSRPIEPSPANQQAPSDRLEASVFAVTANPAAPLGNLAFALRLTSRGDQTISGAAITGPKNISIDVSTGGVSDGSAISPSVAQSKTLAGGPAGQGWASRSPSGRAAADTASNDSGPAPQFSLSGGARSDVPVDAALLAGMQSQRANSSAQPSTTAGAIASLPEKEEAPPDGAPVRSVRLQLSGEANQRVDMRLVERGGALSVSVRSADEGLARSLQDNLPELNSRLAAQHYQTEIWAPGGTASTHSGGNGGSGSESDGSAADGSGGSRQGRSSPDDSSGSKSNSRQPQDGRRRSPPAWVRQIAALEGVLYSPPGGPEAAGSHSGN